MPRCYASWADVRAKAKRLRSSGQVDVISHDWDVVTARVQGDHDTYDVVLWRQDPASEAISFWECTCPWGEWAFKRQYQYVGRMCSHAAALLYEAQSRDMLKVFEGPELYGE